MQNLAGHPKPSVILSDRGKIFTSRRAIEVVVERLGITAERAPAYAPQVKGTVEALFTWTTRKLEHRLPRGTAEKIPPLCGPAVKDSAPRVKLPTRPLVVSKAEPARVGLVTVTGLAPLR